MAPKQKPAALPPNAQAKNKPTAAKSSRLLAVLVIAGIAVLIVGILLLKDRQQPAVARSAAPGNTPTAATSRPAAVNGPTEPSLPAEQLGQALEAGQPVLVFMHSTNCQSCINMMKVVDEVYPAFAEQIVLVDVDVYDEANGPLMQVLGLRYIPTVVVYNRAGKATQNVGAMGADAFRTFLRQNALGG